MRYSFLPVATGLALLAMVTGANALTFDWSWQSSNLGTYPVGTTVSGTVSGLSEGINSSVPVTVTIDGPMSVPSMTGSANADIVGGVITSFTAILADPGNTYMLWLEEGGGGYYPYLEGPAGLALFNNVDTNITFSTLATPEPASMTLLAAGLVGIAVIRRRRAG
jgi:hypothetical protein